MDVIMEGRATPAQIAGFLIALKQKGEMAQEIAGFVEAMRSHAVHITLTDENAVDGCGTGGDGKHSFNISTAAAIVAAASGVTVAKHGNRSVSSRCGSADLLEAAGGSIDSSAEHVAASINEVGFGFMFAPRFHPAMKYAAAPRKELGVRTVFNILGPMTNPAGVARQVIGVYDPSLMERMSEVLSQTGSRHVLVVHSRDGMDEFSVSAPSDYVELCDGAIREKTVAPEDVGLERFPEDSLTGGDVARNLSILTAVLNGTQGAVRQAVLFNAGALVYVAGRVKSIREGVQVASEAVDSGRAKEKLQQWVRYTSG